MEIKTDKIPDIDSLDRTRFAKEIADQILLHLKSSQESLVVGIHGPWGSGKTTLLHYIKQQLWSNNEEPVEEQIKRRSLWRPIKLKKKRSKINILEFNPWMFSRKQELHIMFFDELAASVASKKTKVKKAIRSFSQKIGGDSEVSSWGTLILRFVTQWSSVSIDTLKSETDQLLTKTGFKTIVLMDDLDRLEPREILEIFQLVKLNANFKNTLFLLSFDKAVVLDSISKHSAIDGEKYLEKIVQVDYSLPSILPEDIESIFFGRLQIFIERHNIKFEVKRMNGPWVIHGLNRYFTNIRDINRYFNSINFRLPSFHQNINIHDFLILEAIRLFDYPCYETIRNNYKEALRFGKHSVFKDQLDNIIKTRSYPLYEYLFGVKINVQREDQDYRITDTEYFDRYFSLAVSRKDMREEEINSFITHKETRLLLLESLIRDNKIDFLLRRLATKDFLSEHNEYISLISPLISVWDQHIDAFPKHWHLVWDAIKSIILTTSDSIRGFQHLVNELNMGTSSFSPARFHFTWLLLQNISKEDIKNVDNDLTRFGDFLGSKKNVLERHFISVLGTYQLQFAFSTSYPDFYHRLFLPSSAKYTPDNYRNMFEQIISDDRKIFLLLNILVRRDSKSHAPFAGDFTYLPVLLPDHLKKQFDERLRAINLKSVPKADAKAIEMYFTLFSDR